jgi:flagellar basal-body rod protein FlgB
MDYSQIKLMQMMEVKMGYLAEKQDVLSQNVVNVDTPGYKPKQLKELDFERMALAEARRLKMKTTSAGKSLEGVKQSQDFRTQTQRKTYETTPVENAVSLEEQMAKVAQNQLEYTTVTNLYSKTSSMFKVAIGNN